MTLARPSSFSGSVVSTPNGDEGLSEVRCRRTSKFGYLCSRCSIVCGSTTHSGHEGLVAGSKKWTHVLIISVCPDHRRASITASARFEVVLLSVLREKVSYIMAIRGMLGGGSAMVRSFHCCLGVVPRTRLVKNSAWLLHKAPPVKRDNCEIAGK